MKTLSFGAAGPQVQLLQLALERAGYAPGYDMDSSNDWTFGVMRRPRLPAGDSPAIFGVIPR